MEYIRRLGVVIMAALLVSLGSMSCGHDDDNAAVPEESYAPLADAIYVPIDDEAQPAWLQTLIADEPYLKVFRSEKGEGKFLVEAPQKGDGLRIFDRDGVALPTPADEQLPLTVQDGQPWTLTHIYTFPLKPGDAEWDFDRYTIREIQEKLQLPATLLSGMSTADLLETSLDFSYSTDFLMFDEWQRGVDAVRKEFNGYVELLSRKDLVKTMLKKYEVKMRTAEAIEGYDKLMRGSYSLRFMLFKMLLAQDEMLSQQNRDQLRQLIRLSMEANEMVPRYPDLFGTTHYVPVFYLYSRIILREGGFRFASDEEKSKLEYFALTCTSHPAVLSMFTEDLQSRMYSYLKHL